MHKCITPENYGKSQGRESVSSGFFEPWSILKFLLACRSMGWLSLLFCADSALSKVTFSRMSPMAPA